MGTKDAAEISTVSSLTWSSFGGHGGLLAENLSTRLDVNGSDDGHHIPMPAPVVFVL
jgi:hypothetical protein